jgi:hypothetical protein
MENKLKEYNYLGLNNSQKRKASRAGYFLKYHSVLYIAAVKIQERQDSRSQSRNCEKPCPMWRAVGEEETGERGIITRT